MKSSIIFNYWIPIAALMLPCCNKGENPPISQGEIWDCHHEMTWDSMATQNALIGEWEWEFVRCFWSPDAANDDDFKGLSIEFKSDNTMEVKENGIITQTSTWKVVDGDVDLYAVEVEPFFSQVAGKILFCQNQDRVEFNASYRDGCDNYFKRKK